ncbi:MAG TPA: hypothetical protein VK400_20055, partial [Pyrinomonadaceae bacterium]|nr:hypothetical protein [Pyrinomonadaceae bacterium]
GLLYYGMHRVLGQEPTNPVVNTIAYTLIGTTIVGTIVFLILDGLSMEKGRTVKKRDIFTTRRQTRRRNPIRLGRRT